MVLETPPTSPSPRRPKYPDYFSGDGSTKRSQPADMLVIRDAVKDYIDTEPSTVKAAAPSKSNRRSSLSEAAVEKFSGLQIRNQLVSSIELTDRFSDVRLVRLPAIKNLLSGDTLSGCWVTVGVLTEKGAAKTSSTGKSYCIWKMGCLDELSIPVFLFGDAYTKSSNEPVKAAFALFNSGVRKDAGGKGFSFSVYSSGNILRIGTSADYGVCKGKRKDGIACTMAINKCKSVYCKYHISNASQKYSIMRSELNGGNFHLTSMLQSKGVYVVDPLADKSFLRKPVQRVKVMSVDGLKKALRDRVRRGPRGAAASTLRCRSPQGKPAP